MLSSSTSRPSAATWCSCRRCASRPGFALRLYGTNSYGKMPCSRISSGCDACHNWGRISSLALPHAISLPKKYNIAFSWTAELGVRWNHQKTYLPNDEGYWEANWYDRARIEFQTLEIGSLRLGILICTEIWFMQHARDYGRQGIQLLLVPRSTPYPTNDKWLAGGRARGAGFRRLLLVLQSRRSCRPHRIGRLWMDLRPRRQGACQRLLPMLRL